MDTLKEPLLPKHASKTAAKDISQKGAISGCKLYGIAIFAAIAWAVSNYAVNQLDSYDFATSCLQFPGYLIFSFGYRSKQFMSSENKFKLKHFFFRNVYNFREKEVKSQAQAHLSLNAAIFFAVSLITIYAAYYAMLAQANFGVIIACMTIWTPLQCIHGYYFKGENFTNQMALGLIAVFGGIAIIALSNAETSLLVISDREYFRLVSISFALCLGVALAIRQIHARGCYTEYKYHPMEFSLDLGMITGLALGILSAIFLIAIRPPQYSWHNLWVSSLAAFLRMAFLCSIVSIAVAVKGSGGKFSAIIQSSTLIHTAMSAILQNMIPTTGQVLGQIVAIAGVILMTLGK